MKRKKVFKITLVAWLVLVGLASFKLVYKIGVEKGYDIGANVAKGACIGAIEEMFELDEGSLTN